MALYTSTPKSKLMESVSLLSLDSDNEESSSGYDSPVHRAKNVFKRNCQRKLSIQTSSDDDSSLEDADSRDYNSDRDAEESSTQSMKVTSTDNLVDNIKYILSTPELCDVMFIVGPNRVPVYGLKAILSTRSRMFFALFLKHQKESMKEKKKSKKTKLNTEHGNRLSIILDNYDSDIFRTFLLFVHCGSIRMNATNVTGILCLATEYDIPDLRSSCWKFIERCITVPAHASLLMKDTFKYGESKAAQKLRIQILKFSAQRQMLVV